LTNRSGSWEKPDAVMGSEVANSPFESRNPTPVEVIAETFWVGSPPVDSAVAIGIP
jgi:hypothetical protein